MFWQVPWDAVLKNIKDYNPIAMAMWEKGVAAPYLHVGRALASMDSTTKRLRISDVIANMFRSLLALSPGKTAFVLSAWPRNFLSLHLLCLFLT